MLKKENPIILKMNDTLPVLHLETTKEFCFVLLQKGE
jgi:hypothetical protein